MVFPCDTPSACGGEFHYRVNKYGTYSITYAVSKSDDQGRYNVLTYDWVDNAVVFRTQTAVRKHIHAKVLVPIETSYFLV